MGVNVGTHLCIRQPGKELTSLCEGPWIPRNYKLYGLMAGVRGDITLFEPRGIPEDASERLLWDIRDSQHAADEHSHSWLTTGELKEVAAAYESEPSCYYESVRFERTDPPPPERTTKLGPHFAATIGAMEALDRWCDSNGGGQAILVFSFG